MPRSCSVSTSCFRSMPRSGSLVGWTKQMAVRANREIAFAPAGNIVQLGGVGGGPAVGRFAHLRDDGRDFCIQGNIPPGGMRRRRRQ